jgi:nucleotide-binding universal stress UspA family protein
MPVSSLNILLAADGSRFTARAARYLAAHLRDFTGVPAVHILHVHAPLPFAGASGVVGRAAIDRYHQEESEKAIAVAVKPLQKAGIKCTTSWVVGDVAREVAASVERHKADMVVVGTHGSGGFLGIPLGSTAMKIIAAVKAPVLVVP